MKLKFRYSVPYDRMLTLMMGMEYSDEQERMVKKYIKDISVKWDIIGKKTITEIEKVSGLKFKGNMDCFVVNKMYYIAISHPFTIEYGLKFGDLKSIIIHELIHIILVQNGDKILDYLNSLYVNKDADFRLHLPVLLIERKVDENLFGKEYFKKISKKERKFEDLKPVWKEVDKLYPKFNRGIIDFLKRCG